MIYILTFLLILTISILIYYSFRINEDRTIARVDKHLRNNQKWVYNYILSSLIELGRKYNNEELSVDIENIVSIIKSGISDLEKDSKNEKRN